VKDEKDDMVSPYLDSRA